MKLVESVLLELQEDYVGLWQLFREARSTEPSGTDIAAIVMTTTSELLRIPNVAVGDFIDNEFVEWTKPTDQIIEEVSAKLARLNRDPDIGEVCWFSLKSH